MSKSFLITRPKHEFLTNLLFHWSVCVINDAQKRRYQVLDLKEDKANRKMFVSYIKKNKPSFVFLNGHGSESTVTGHDNEVLIEVDNGDDLLAGSVVYARSCHAAKKLGPATIKKGAKAFLGYKRPFTIASSQTRPSQPLNDELAELFIQPSNLVPLALLKGNSVKVADERSKKAMAKNVLFMLSSEATSEQRSVASYLWSNLKAQVIVGDSSAIL